MQQRDALEEDADRIPEPDHETYVAMNWESYRLFSDKRGGLFALDWEIVTHNWGGNV